MSGPARPTMRMLSFRLRHLQSTKSSVNCSQIRLLSARYSNPERRRFAVSPSQPSYFSKPEGQKYLNAASATFTAPRNPMDTVQRNLDWEEVRAYNIRKIRFSAMGLVISVAGLAAFVYCLDIDRMEEQRAHKLDASSEGNAMFQGKEVHVVGAGDGKRITAEGQGEEIELVETGTSSVPHFPRTIYLPTSSEVPAPATSIGSIAAAQPNTGQDPSNVQNEEEYTLLGLGIRTVSFLSIQVYVVGFYVRTQDIGSMQKHLIKTVNPTASTLIPAEKEELQRRLLDPEASREIWQDLLKVPGIKTAWRITPTRNTDFSHLRDGWITGIGKQTRGLAEYNDSDSFGQSVKDFKAIFTGGKAPKGSIMILARNVLGGMDVLYYEKPAAGAKENGMERLGQVSDERIGKLIWMGYLAGNNVSSEAARKGVVDGCVAFAGRPVGSVETMVT